MTCVKDILENLQMLAPVENKMDFDNVGLLVGDPMAAVQRVLLTLDVRSAVIQEARETQTQLIVAHHPLFFGLKQVNRADPTGARILDLAKSGISEISMHTNLDAAVGGVNDALAAALGLTQVRALTSASPGRDLSAVPRLGDLPAPKTLAVWLPELRQALSAPGLRFYDAGHPVEHVAVLGGSGGEALEMLAAAGCDTFVTADVKYHVFLQAEDLGINLVDAGHFETETVVLRPLLSRLQGAFPELDISIAKENHGIIQFA